MHSQANLKENGTKAPPKDDNEGHGRDDHSEHPSHLVTIEVNTKPVEIEGPRVKGLGIKQAAIEQGVDIKLDFVLSQILGEGGRKTEIVGNEDTVTVHNGSKFVAVPPDDNSEGPTSRYTEAVARAIDELRHTFSGATVTAVADGEGGAYVIVEPVALTGIYKEPGTWVGARITFQYPFCDIYPLFVRGDLVRRDGAALGEAMSAGHRFQDRPAVQLSRRSKQWNPATDTAALKFLKTINWVGSRP